MSDFEHDDELRDALRRAHPARRDAGPTLAANRARMARARSHRRAAVGSIAAASLVVVGAAIFAVNGTTDTNTVDVIAPPSTGAVVSSTTIASPPVPSTTRVGTDQPTAPPPTQPSSSESTTSRPTSTTTAPTTVGPARKTHTGRGGTVTVTWTTSAITIEQVTDELGWTHTVNKNESDDIEIEWRRSNPGDQAKIRLRLVDGAIREEID